MSKYLTDADLDALAEDYAPFDPGACRVCGGKLEVVSVGFGSVTWGHPKPQDGKTTYGEWQEHFVSSKVTSHKPSDWRVRALLEEVRMRRSQASGPEGSAAFHAGVSVGRDAGLEAALYEVRALPSYGPKGGPTEFDLDGASHRDTVLGVIQRLIDPGPTVMPVPRGRKRIRNDNG